MISDANDGGAPSGSPPLPPPRPQPRGSLPGDRVTVTLTALFVLSALPLIVPVLSASARGVYGRHIVGTSFLVALIVLLVMRARAAPLGVERRFWTLLSAAFLLWLSAQVFDVVTVVTEQSLSTIRLLNNVPFLLCYGVLAMALEAQPHVASDPSTGRLRAVDRIASFVFLLGLLMYFLVLPRLTTDHFVWASSLALFVAVDVYILLRLYSLRQATEDAEWRATYSWLLVGAAIWGLGDLAVLFQNQGVMPNLPYGTPLDLIWPAAFVAVAVATRAGAYQPETRPPAHALRRPAGMGHAVVYAALFPFLHLLLYRFASFDPSSGPSRELLVLVTVATLGAIAFVYHGLIQAENQRRIQEEEDARQRLAHLAFHDELTGLPNREMFQDHLRLAIADAGRYRRKCAVLFCDLDRFKVINDSLGHEAGDQVLVATAERLVSCVRVLDTVARFGGDEFTIILHGINSPLDAARIAEKMLEVISTPLTVKGKKHVLTTSLGIAVCPDDGKDETTLLKHADTAMYQAKLHGRNTYKLFTEAMNAAAEERLAIEQGLRTTPMEDNFAVFYQPVIGLAKNEPIGYEALLRWNHPKRGYVTPESFLDVAEQTGLIVPIGQWVLETACAWAMKIGAALPEPPTIAVNISGRQLQEPTFVDDTMAIVERTGLPPSRLQLEITEPIALDTASTEPLMFSLRARGVRIAVDDFGTGFAALSRLKDFPVDVVKIDRSFIKGIEANSVGETIVRAIVTMSKALDFSVVAEGVETKEEFEVVKELRCDAVQGFYVQGPTPPEELERAFARK